MPRPGRPTCAAFAPRRSCSIGASPRPRPWTKLQAAIAAEPQPKAEPLRCRRDPRRAPEADGRCGWAPRRRLILATVIGLLPLMNRASRRRRHRARRRAQRRGHRRIGGRGIRKPPKSITRRPSTICRRIANKDTGELDPQVAAVLQKNLTVIDQAISESRAALKTQPSSTNAQDGLFDALRTKVALLQQTVELINEMRKGNQAEAGRRAQTLSQ